MIRYETLMLTVPEITQDEAKRLESEVDRVIKSGKANLISFDKWGKCRLAYPVKKNDYGVYYLVRFEMEENPNAVLDELRSIFTVKLNDMVMRYMISSLDPKVGLEYERPSSVEEAPSRETPAFFRENRAEGGYAPESKGMSEDIDQDLEDEEA